jgi:hypothetical protein
VTQLDLLTRTEARKLLSAKEFDVQCMVADDLNRWLKPGWFASHIGHGEKRDLKAAQRLKRGGLKPGLPDFIIIGPSKTCGFHFLELKRAPNKLTEEQKAVADVIESAQGKYAVAYGYEAAKAVLIEWGALRVAA